MIQVVSAPAFTAVTLEEAKAHLNAQDYADHDTIINLYIRAATAWAEDFTGVAFVDQTLDFYADGFPVDNGYIRLPRLPVISVEGVYYTQSASPPVTLDAGVYGVDNVGGRIFLYSGGSWPTINSQLNSVRVRYRAGYALDGDDDSPPYIDVPDQVKAAILLTVGTLYDNREDVVVGQSVSQLPLTAQHLLRPLRVNTAIG